MTPDGRITIRARSTGAELSKHALSGQCPRQSLPTVFYAGFLKSSQIQPLQESVDSLIRTIKIIVFQKLPDVLPRPGNPGKYFIVIHHKLRFAVCFCITVKRPDSCKFIYTSTYSEMILPISPISTFPLNSKVASNPFANRRNSSESGTSSMKPGV